MVEIANGLVRRGHQVTILMPSNGIVEFDNILASIVRAKSAIIQADDYPMADVIVSNFYTTIPAVRVASQQGKGMHVRFSLCYEPIFWKENEISFPSYHATDKLIVLSNWQQQLIALLHGIQGKVVPVGVDSVFKNHHIRHSQANLVISAILRKPEGGFIFQRDQDYLIHSLSRIKQLHPGAQIHFIAPPMEAATSPFLQSIRTNPMFKVFTPKNDAEINYLYNISHIFVTTSIYETANLVALEAMRTGAALVSTYSGGNMDICKHEENCMLSYRYENRLVADIHKLIMDRKLLVRIAEAGEKEAIKWTWQRSAEQFESAVREFLAKG
ncbi:MULTISPECIES: glycosyltransferase family 4 protein [unclassified Paenibacillus]|uniref:glycosyltransferase family 4 protein n=1 Tax=unclassified Paenibacillus TaxID=185978 RepID=UPI0027D8ED67|nr:MULTISPECIES: glycosyltransferase family 4 protein [unclassified Paenibacillus]